LSKRWRYIGFVVSSFGIREMVSISSTSIGAQSATQAGWQQLRLQQARQNADRAEQAARALEARAADAQRIAERADENARSLFVQADQANSVAGQARQGLAMVRSVGEMQVSLSNTVSQVVARDTGAKPAEMVVSNTELKPKAVAPPVLNLSGQVTGTMVNTTA
jgi:hypothetical protein